MQLALFSQSTNQKYSQHEYCQILTMQHEYKQPHPPIPRTLFLVTNPTCVYSNMEQEQQEPQSVMSTPDKSLSPYPWSHHYTKDKEGSHQEMFDLEANGNSDEKAIIPMKRSPTSWPTAEPTQ